MTGDLRPPVELVIFDWAGTVIDHGSRAPMRVMCEVFRRAGVAVSIAEARKPMGQAKRDHIAAVLAMPRVSEAWSAEHGGAPSDADVDRLYAEFLPLQEQLLAEHVDILPGALEAVADCRRRGLMIGSTTGYTRALMDVVIPLAQERGYAPDSVLCADDVTEGRPSPEMIRITCDRLGVADTRSVVKVDDTPVGIEAGRRADARTVAVARTGNALGLSADEVAALDADELRSRLATIHADFEAAGADFVIDDLTEFPAVLDRIMAAGDDKDARGRGQASTPSAPS